MSAPITQRMQTMISGLGPVIDFFTTSTWSKRAGEPGTCDFVAGNPHEPPIPEFVDALKRAAEPRDNEWFAYKLNEPGPVSTVVRSLRADRGMAFEADDVFMTGGTFGALAVALSTLAEPGDEVIFLSPPWFFYEAMIRATGATAVGVKLAPPTFDLDLEAIGAAISPRTRAIIVNSPNNPGGRIYPPGDLDALARSLEEASERNGRPVYLLSDESYWKIRFDGRPYHSPATHYVNSILMYTYGKTLLTPGQRVGFLALRPDMPHRETLRTAMFVAQIAGGWLFPTAIMQHALPDIESLSVDVGHLEKKRDRMVEGLREIGYELPVPEGTFYLVPRSPEADDVAFTERLAAHDVFVLPGAVAELPGYFRISLTASDDMIERSFAGFEAAMRETGPG